jgi:3-hydroxyisobutyrate dehydrogenase-like beta-hydroxyacid dehydrogenase
MTNSAIGFIGLGRMGNPIARRIAAAGFHVVAYDVDAAAVEGLASEARTTAAATASGVSDAADVVITCLPTPEILQTVVLGQDGVIEGRRAKYVIDISTTGPRVAREVAAALVSRGKTFIDAPVTGGVAGAKSGALTIILGAAPDAIAATRPILDAIANKLVVAGPRAGDGQMLKVINNLLSFVALEATAEAMVLGVKAGLDPDVMLETFNAGTGRNSATEEKFPRSVMTRSFDFGFPVRGVMKDIGLCLAEAEAMAVPMPVGMCTRQIWTMAMNERGNEDMTTIVKLFERWAGVEVRSRRESEPVSPSEVAAIGR